VRSRLVATGTLRLTSPFHTRGNDVETGLDAPLLKDGAGRHLIAGRSLAGALRAWALAAFPADGLEVIGLFGSSGDSTGAASRIQIDDLPLHGAREVLRDGVGINRHTGAAADKFKYDRTVLAPGATADFRLVCSPIDDDDSTEWGIVQGCLAALRDGLISVGGLVSKGHGRFVVDGLEWSVARSGRSDLLAHLAGTLPSHPADGTAPAASQATILVSFAQRSPVFVLDPLPVAAVDHLPRMEPFEGRCRLVVPATSLKGSLRSEAERIVRTVTGSDVAPGDFASQLDVPLVRDAFGSANDDDSGTGSRACLWMDDLRSVPVCTEAQWDAVRGTDGSIKENSSSLFAAALRTAGLDSWRVMVHVAVDRLTGGVIPGRLFSHVEPHGTEWEPVEFRLQVHDAAEARLHLALLLLALDGLHRGTCGVGFGFNRGYGRLAVSGIDLLDAGHLGLDDASLAFDAGAPLLGQCGPLADVLRDEWSTWCGWAKAVTA